jgi:hypothetical protein
MFNVDRPDWQQFANCRGLDTNLFFPTNGKESAESRAIIKPICEACMVFDQCFAYAVKFPEKALQGFWANTSEGDRRRMRYSATPVGYRRKQPDNPKGPT